MRGMIIKLYHVKFMFIAFHKSQQRVDSYFYGIYLRLRLPLVECTLRNDSTRFGMRCARLLYVYFMPDQTKKEITAYQTYPHRK